MSDKKTLTFALMDAPFESARSTTALRLINIAAKRGYNVNVFAYEGAVVLPFTKQSAHANAVHGHDIDEHNHPLPYVWIDEIRKVAEAAGGSLEWINCGLCADERGVAEALPFVKRGTPGHLIEWAEASDNTLVIGTRS
jgi:tRNA 2-thiouridine synthesizing protein D